MSKTLRFWKMSGAGNDFIVVDARKPLEHPADHLARQLCPRAKRVGADGLLMVRSIEGDTVVVDYCNSDGSSAEFCGNGARCVARFVRDILKIPISPLKLKFPGATAMAEVDEHHARVIVPLPDTPERLHFPGLESYELWQVQAGVPHLLEVSQGPESLQATAARVWFELARHDNSLVDEWNISAISFDSVPRIRIATRERGAEFTLACGSAAIAAARFAQHSRGGSMWTVLPPGGLPLRVTLREKDAVLDGEARVVYRGDAYL